MNIRLLIFPFALLLCLALCIGCASPPTELIEARRAYQAAYADETRTRAPTALQEAERTLHLAESSYAEDGDSERTRALAYAAERRVEQARVEAEINKLQEAQKPPAATNPPAKGETPPAEAETPAPTEEASTPPPTAEEDTPPPSEEQ